MYIKIKLSKMDTFAVENSSPRANRRNITPNWATVSTWMEKKKSYY
jgi:hypothetical protein